MPCTFFCNEKTPPCGGGQRQGKILKPLYSAREVHRNPKATGGSRLRIEILQPRHAIVDHVITVCSPPEFVAWIDHFCGQTMEQWVTFHALPGGGTSIHTWADIVDGQNARGFVQKFIEQWYNRFSNECDLLAEQPELV